jgi:hypothetical protein
MPGRRNFITLYPFRLVASCHGTVVRGRILEASTEVCSPFVGERPSHNAYDTGVRLDEQTSLQDSEPAPSPGEMRFHGSTVAKLVSTSATKPGAEVALPFASSALHYTQ